MITLIIAAIYIFSSGNPENYGYFLSESRIIFIVLFLPTVLTGLITAWLKNTILSFVPGPLSFAHREPLALIETARKQQGTNDK